MIDINIKTSQSYEQLQAVGKEGLFTVTMPQGWTLLNVLNGGNKMAKTLLLWATDGKCLTERFFIGSPSGVNEVNVVHRSTGDRDAKKVLFKVGEELFTLNFFPKRFKKPSILEKKGSDAIEMEILW